MANNLETATDEQIKKFESLKINEESVIKAEKTDTATKAVTPLLQEQLQKTLVDIGSDTVKLEVQQNDPNSPIYSVKNFEDLNLKEDVLQGISDMGFTRPSKIQETALPMLLRNPPENMIAQSQSGTGKTAAFVLTMLQRIDLEEKVPQCICLLPTYELALQTGMTVKNLAKHLKGFSIEYAVKENKS